MTKLDIKNALYKAEYDIKYKLAKIRFPEVDKIFKGDRFSLDFKSCATTHDYLKKCIRRYNCNAQPVELAYQDVLFNLAHLINDIKYDPNILEILYMYSYIYYNGYLSVDNKFVFDIPNKEVEYKRALSVFDGQGVCRNTGALFSDLLNVFDIYSFGIITDRNSFISEEILLNNEYYNLCHSTDEEELVKKIDIMLETTEFGTASTGNHYEVVAHYKGWHLLDPSALAAYKITKKENEYAANKFLRYWYLYASGEYSLEETVRLYNLLRKTYLKTYTSDKFIELQDRCYDICEKNKRKIKTFHDRMNENINLLSYCLPKKD